MRYVIPKVFYLGYCMRKPIDVEEVKNVFRIRNGNLERFHAWKYKDTWRTVKNKNNHAGYCNVYFNGKKAMYQNIVWILITGEDIPKGLELDHINGNRIDNRMENLRLVTRRSNSENKVVNRCGKLVGTSFIKDRNKYVSQLRICGNSVYIGYYDTEIEAHKAYRLACKRITEFIDKKSFREMIKKEMKKEQV